MERKDVVVLGELNVDLILQDIPSFPELGKEKLANNMKLTMGSASAILASNIARLGINTGFIGKLGRDIFAHVVLGTLKERNVDCSAIVQDITEKTGITIALTYPQDYAMITYMGAMKNFSKKDVDFEYLKNASHLHFSSYYLQPGIQGDIADIFKFAKDNGLTTSMDPGWDPSENWTKEIYKLLDYTDIIMPNDREAMLISGCGTVEEAAIELTKHSKMAMIKCGSKGSYFLGAGESYKTNVFSINPLDTTGAGDSFNAGFLYGYINKKDLRTCVLYGNACGALATTKMGGAEASPNVEELNTFLYSHKEEDIFIQ